MRYSGKEFDGEGVVVAVIDSGIDEADTRFQNTSVQGWRVRLKATNHVVVDGVFSDENGHGTEVAAAVLRHAPKASLISIRIMDKKLRTSADLMAVGIETAYKSGAHVINLSLGTPNMGKAMLLRDCCIMAQEAGVIMVASAHPKGQRAYPADIPEVIGVSSQPECAEKMYYFDENFYPRKEWKGLSGKFLTGGREVQSNINTYRGVGFAAAHISGRFACLRQALPKAPPSELIAIMQRRAFLPTVELGY